jgi:hypothetical protein
MEKTAKKNTGFVNKTIRTYLIEQYGFTMDEIKHNADLFENVISQMPDFIGWLAGDVKVQANSANNPKGYLINALKKEKKALNSQIDKIVCQLNKLAYSEFQKLADKFPYEHVYNQEMGVWSNSPYDLYETAILNTSLLTINCNYGCNGAGWSVNFNGDVKDAVKMVLYEHYISEIPSTIKIKKRIYEKKKNLNYKRGTGIKSPPKKKNKF